MQDPVEHVAEAFEIARLRADVSIQQTQSWCVRCGLPDNGGLREYLPWCNSKSSQQREPYENHSMIMICEAS